MYCREWRCVWLVLAGLASCRAGVCEVREHVPANQHMCYSVWGEVEEVVIRDIPRRKWVLEEPADCKSPFPCFGTVKEVVEVEQVPVTVRVCQLDPIWRRPRRIQQTYDGVTLVLSPGYFQERNFSNQLLCLWNVTCPTGHTLFVNATSLRLDNSHGDGEECSEYVEVEWGGRREVRCAGQQGPWLMNQVSPHDMRAIFRTGDGSVGLGLRLDTACYSPAVQHTAGAPTQQGLPASRNCSSQTQAQSTSAELSGGEEWLVRQTFSLHFDLHMLLNACSRGVRECARFHAHHMTSRVRDTLDALASAPSTCSSLVQSLLLRTLDLYGYQ